MAQKKETICVVGLGYIGLPTACLLAESGHEIIGVDINSSKLSLLQSGQLPFTEPGLNQLFNRINKQIRFSSLPQPADIFIICVPTPSLPDKRSDLSYVVSAIQAINAVLQSGNLVILESTVPPGSTEHIVRPLIASDKIGLAYVPERAIPGNTLYEMQHNSRIVGGIDRQSAERAQALYQTFVTGEIHLTDLLTAEATKLVENSHRDTNIAFVNELAKLCDSAGINVWELIRLANLHPRVNLLQPGPGVGGHCLPIDPWFLIENTPPGADMIKLARQINDTMPDYVISQLQELLSGIDNPTITILGVSYKADVDDARETPAARLVQLAHQLGWRVILHDPFVSQFNCPVTATLTDATMDSDCLVLITNHSTYNQLSPAEITNMKHRQIFDTRNMIDAQKWRLDGFIVKQLGNGSIRQSTIIQQSDQSDR